MSPPDSRNGAPPQSAVCEISRDQATEPGAESSAARMLIVPEQRGPTGERHHFPSCRGEDRAWCERLRSDPAREDGGCLFDDVDRDAPKPPHDVEVPFEIAVAYAVTEALIQAEQAAMRALLPTLHAPSPAAVAGMVRRVIDAGPDRWTAMRWLEERLATHVLVGRLTVQAATTTLDRTLAALPPALGDDRDGATRLLHASVRAYRRALGDASTEVRQHLTRAWAEAVDESAAVGEPLDDVPWLGIARRWLSDVETAEAYG